MHVPVKAEQTKPEGDFEFVLFAGPKLGSSWPQVLRLRHTTIVSVDYEWPEWLPHIDVKTFAPVVAGAHPRWPLGREGKPLAGSRVAAVFTNDPVVRQILFRKGWIDVSKPYHAAEQAHREALANPEPEPTPSILDSAVSAVQAIAEAATGRRPRRAAAPA